MLPLKLIDEISSINPQTPDTNNVHIENRKNGTRPLECYRSLSSKYVPKDRQNRVYLIFCILGISTHTPWLFFINAGQFWDYKFRNEITNGTTKMAEQFNAQFNLVFAVPYSLFLILHIFLRKKISTKIRVIATQLTTIIIFMMTTFYIHSHIESKIGILVVTLASAGALSALGSTFTGTLFSIIGRFPLNYISALLQGQAASGILAAICQIFSLYLGTTSDSTAVIYFIIGNVVLILSYFAYLCLERQEFFKYHMKEKQGKYLDNIIRYDEKSVKISYMKIWKKVLPYGLSMFLVFFMTCSVYPSVNDKVKSQASMDSEWYKTYFTPVATYLFFSLGNGFGCLLSGHFNLLDERPDLALILSAFRIIFIPIFWISNIGNQKYFPICITSDVVYMIIMIMFSIIHGYMWSALFFTVSRVVEDCEREIALDIMGAFLGLGYLFGALISYLFIR